MFVVYDDVNVSFHNNQNACKLYFCPKMFDGWLIYECIHYTVRKCVILYYILMTNTGSPTLMLNIKKSLYFDIIYRYTYSA